MFSDKFPSLFPSGWQTGTQAQMAEVMEGIATAAVPNTSVDWQKRCIALETQLMRFRLQAGNIRHLLAERVKEGVLWVTQGLQNRPLHSSCAYDLFILYILHSLCMHEFI